MDGIESGARAQNPFPPLDNEEEGGRDAGLLRIPMQYLPLSGKRLAHQPLEAVSPNGIKGFTWNRECDPDTG